MKITLDEIKEKTIPLLKEAGVTRSSLFGSYVRDEARENSDIDILVEFPEGKGLFAFIRLQRKLEETLKKKVDLGTYQSINPSLRENILKDQYPLI